MSLLFFLSISTFYTSCGKDENYSASDRKRVAVIKLEPKTLRMIPNNFEVFYIYSVKSIDIIENEISKRQSAREIDRHACYLSPDKSKMFEESKKCIDRFQVESGKIDYLVLDGTEELVMLGGKLRSHFGVKVGLDEEHASFVTDKVAMKNQLTKKDHTIKTAKYFEVSKKDIQGDFSKYIKAKLKEVFGETWQKVVFKPSSDAGSRGVHFVENNERLDETLKKYYISDFSEALDLGKVIVEEFVEGQILRMDGYVLSGKLCINFTSGYTIPPKRFYGKGDPQLTLHKGKEADKKVYDTFAQQVVSALEYRNGIIHLEAIQKTNGDLYFLEIAARTGGTLYPILSSLGFNPEKAYVYSNLGISYKYSIKNQTFAVVSLPIPKDVPENTREMWLSDFSHEDPKNFRTFRADLSKDEPLVHTYLDLQDDANIGIKVFVGGDHALVYQEAQAYYKSLEGRIKLIGGHKDGQWMYLENQQWVSH
jgi:hypothetical protein